jgi:hypothetical protein
MNAVVLNSETVGCVRVLLKSTFTSENLSLKMGRIGLELRISVERTIFIEVIIYSFLKSSSIKLAKKSYSNNFFRKYYHDNFS